MGFWHTGYMEHHEYSGLGDFEPSPLKFPCEYCDEVYDSTEDLRQHRFESHPLHRPILFLHGRELGANPVRITRLLTQREVQIDNCDQAFLNNDEIPVFSVPDKLSGISSDVCKLELRKDGVSAKFSLDFCIASEADLKGVETQFERIARGYRLDIRTVEDFISATENFGTAGGYINGICEYLYGVLVKEQAPDATLPREDYVRKFSMAAEALSVYERPLAQMIGRLIAFHFNHFNEAADFAGRARVGHVAKKYNVWLQDKMAVSTNGDGLDFASGKLESLVTDSNTEKILRWACEPLDSQIKHTGEMEAFLRDDIMEYDSVKVRVLLGEIYSKSGDVMKALEQATALRNLPISERWAETMIRAHTERKDGYI